MQARELNRPHVSVESTSIKEGQILQERLAEIGFPSNLTVISNPPLDYIVCLPAFMTEHGVAAEGSEEVNRFLIAHNPAIPKR